MYVSGVDLPTRYVKAPKPSHVARMDNITTCAAITVSTDKWEISYCLIHVDRYQVCLAPVGVLVYFLSACNTLPYQKATSYFSCVMCLVLFHEHNLVSK